MVTHKMIETNLWTNILIARSALLMAVLMSFSFFSMGVCVGLGMNYNGIPILYAFGGLVVFATLFDMYINNVNPTINDLISLVTGPGQRR